MAFRESDIPALDFIIDKTLESDWKVYSNELTESGFLKETDPNLESKFESLLAIVASYGCAKVNPAHNADNGANAEKNSMTAKFKADGGFMTAFKQLQVDSAKDKETKLKEQLEIKNLKLQNENLEYSKTIRDQEARIRDLEEQNKFIELLKGYWWVLLICVGIGAALLELLDRIVP